MNVAGHQQRNAIILLIDGLNPCLLSPFGCTWIDTPTFDELAGDSVVFERGIAETVDPLAAIQGFISGQHPALLPDMTQAGQPLDTIGQAGIHRLLMTDDPGQFAAASELFDQILHLTPDRSPPQPQSADELATTKLARCFATALTELPQQSSPFLCVLHLTSLTTLWDAPLALRQKHRDEDDPAALQVVIPPSVSGMREPDEILGLTQAYAAQLEVLDTCLDVFLTELRLDGLLENTLLLLAGLRGMPLGQQGQVGHQASHLGSDATWVPLFVRPADCRADRQTAMRSHELTVTSEWLAVAESWLLPETADRLTSLIRADQDPQFKGHLASRHFAVVLGDDARALWTPAWLLVQQSQKTRLFVKPEDRWDVNPVQDRCRPIAEALSALLQEAVDQLAGQQTPTLDLLADELVFGLE